MAFNVKKSMFAFLTRLCLKAVESDCIITLEEGGWYTKGTSVIALQLVNNKIGGGKVPLHPRCISP